MNQKDKPIYLTYIGTTKLAFLKGYSRPDGKSEVSALSARLAEGFERGIVKDLIQAGQTLSNSVSEIMGEEKSIVPSRLVISNTYLKSYTFQSSVYFQGNPHPITLKDVRAAIAQTRSVANIPLQEVIVQAVPQEFLVNDLSGVQNPLGLEASRLGVTLRLLTLDGLVYGNLLRVFERCDLEMSDIIPSVLACSHSVLSAQEKQTGVILVVIGGEATHFACYKNSVLVETRSIPVGSDCMTHVISKHLNLDHLDAQRLKESFGSAVPKTEFKDELIPVRDTDHKKKYPIKRCEFETQMASGISSFFKEIKTEIQALQSLYAPLNQVVFTGGGVKLEGFLDAAQEIISPVSRIGTALNVDGQEQLVSDPAFSAALGGILFTSRISEHDMMPQGNQNWINRTVEAARNWIFEYL